MPTITLTMPTMSWSLLFTVLGLVVASLVYHDDNFRHDICTQIKKTMLGLVMICFLLTDMFCVILQGAVDLSKVFAKFGFEVGKGSCVLAQDYIRLHHRHLHNTLEEVAAPHKTVSLQFTPLANTPPSKHQLGPHSRKNIDGDDFTLEQQLGTRDDVNARDLTGSTAHTGKASVYSRQPSRHTPSGSAHEAKDISENVDQSRANITPENEQDDVVSDDTDNEDIGSSHDDDGSDNDSDDEDLAGGAAELLDEDIDVDETDDADLYTGTNFVLDKNLDPVGNLDADADGDHESETGTMIVGDAAVEGDNADSANDVEFDINDHSSDSIVATNSAGDDDDQTPRETFYHTEHVLFDQEASVTGVLGFGQGHDLSPRLRYGFGNIEISGVDACNKDVCAGFDNPVAPTEDEEQDVVHHAQPDTQSTPPINAGVDVQGATASTEATKDITHNSVVASANEKAQRREIEAKTSKGGDAEDAIDASETNFDIDGIMSVEDLDATEEVAMFMAAPPADPAVVASVLSFVVAQEKESGESAPEKKVPGVSNDEENLGLDIAFQNDLGATLDSPEIQLSHKASVVEESAATFTTSSGVSTSVFDSNVKSAPEASLGVADANKDRKTSQIDWPKVQARAWARVIVTRSQEEKARSRRWRRIQRQRRAAENGEDSEERSDTKSSANSAGPSTPDSSASAIGGSVDLTKGQKQIVYTLVEARSVTRLQYPDIAQDEALARVLQEDEDAAFAAAVARQEGQAAARAVVTDEDVALYDAVGTYSNDETGMVSYHDEQQKPVDDGQCLAEPTSERHATPPKDLPTYSDDGSDNDNSDEDEASGSEQHAIVNRSLDAAIIATRAPAIAAERVQMTHVATAATDLLPQIPEPPVLLDLITETESSTETEEVVHPPETASPPSHEEDFAPILTTIDTSSRSSATFAPFIGLDMDRTDAFDSFVPISNPLIEVNAALRRPSGEPPCLNKDISDEKETDIASEPEVSDIQYTVDFDSTNEETAAAAIATGVEQGVGAADLAAQDGLEAEVQLVGKQREEINLPEPSETEVVAELKAFAEHAHGDAVLSTGSVMAAHQTAISPPQNDAAAVGEQPTDIKSDGSNEKQLGKKKKKNKKRSRGKKNKTGKAQSSDNADTSVAAAEHVDESSASPEQPMQTNTNGYHAPSTVQELPVLESQFPASMQTPLVTRVEHVDNEATGLSNPAQAEHPTPTAETTAVLSQNDSTPDIQASSQSLSSQRSALNVQKYQLTKNTTQTRTVEGPKAPDEEDVASQSQSSDCIDSGLNEGEPAEPQSSQISPPGKTLRKLPPKMTENIASKAKKPKSPRADDKDPAQHPTSGSKGKGKFKDKKPQYKPMQLSNEGIEGATSAPETLSTSAAPIAFVKATPRTFSAWTTRHPGQSTSSQAPYESASNLGIIDQTQQVAHDGEMARRSLDFADSDQFPALVSTPIKASRQKPRVLNIGPAISESFEPQTTMVNSQRTISQAMQTLPRPSDASVALDQGMERSSPSEVTIVRSRSMDTNSGPSFGEQPFILLQPRLIGVQAHTNPSLSPSLPNTTQAPLFPERTSSSNEVAASNETETTPTVTEPVGKKGRRKAKMEKKWVDQEEQLKKDTRQCDKQKRQAKDKAERLAKVEAEKKAEQVRGVVNGREKKKQERLEKGQIKKDRCEK